MSHFVFLETKHCLSLRLFEGLDGVSRVGFLIDTWPRRYRKKFYFKKLLKNRHITAQVSFKNSEFYTPETLTITNIEPMPLLLYYHVHSVILRFNCVIKLLIVGTGKFKIVSFTRLENCY